jgi:ABC-type uncharacterized transport system auxiliary subunit
MPWNWKSEQGVRADPKVLLTALAALGLVACSGVLTSKEAPARVYRLEPFPAPALVAPTIDATLAVRVRVVPGLDSDRLLTLDPDGRVNHLGNARWPDYLPEFAASLLQRYVQAGGYFAEVLGDPARSTHDCLLDLLVQRFYTRLDQQQRPVSVELALTGALQCGETRTVLGLEGRADVQAASIAAVVAAHQRAFNAIGGQLRLRFEEFDRLRQTQEAAMDANPPDG